MADYNWGQGAKGAAGGAMTGAAVGSVIPGIGTAVGAGAGALIGGGIGLFSGNGENANEGRARAMMEQYYRELQTRQAPQMGKADQSAYSGFRQNQASLISRLEAMANGQGPSLARQQFEQATDRNMRGQQAMAASGRGGPMSQLTAQNNMAMLGANAAQGSALARTNEQMQAIGYLGGTINQGRQSDEATNQFNANANNQQAIHNLDARLRAMGIADQSRLQIIAQLTGQNAAVAGRPGTGDQLMAGGAGALSMANAYNAQQRTAPAPASQPYQAAPSYSTTGPVQMMAQPFNYNYSNIGNKP